jgi:hypothetical protein
LVARSRRCGHLFEPTSAVPHARSRAPPARAVCAAARSRRVSISNWPCAARFWRGARATQRSPSAPSPASKASTMFGTVKTPRAGDHHGSATNGLASPALPSARAARVTANRPLLRLHADNGQRVTRGERRDVLPGQLAPGCPGSWPDRHRPAGLVRRGGRIRTGVQSVRCCTLLLYKLSDSSLGFRIVSLTCEATETRIPDLACRQKGVLELANVVAVNKADGRMPRRHNGLPASWPGHCSCSASPRTDGPPRSSPAARRTAPAPPRSGTWSKTTATCSATAAS